MRIRRTAKRFRCPLCGRAGQLPRRTIAWWCAAEDEVSVLAPHLVEQLQSPGAHLAEIGDGSPARVFVLETSREALLQPIGGES